MIVAAVLLETPCEHPECQRRKGRREMVMCTCCGHTHWTGRAWCWAAVTAAKAALR